MKNKKIQSKVSTGCIQYEGIVTATIKTHGQIILTKKFKNHGNLPLFNFLSQCLLNAKPSAGDAPWYLRLFTFEGEAPTPSASAAIVPGTSVPIISATYFATAQLLNSNEVEASTSQVSGVKFIFNIPAALAVNAFSNGASNITVYQAALYSQNNSPRDSLENYSTVYNFLTAGGEWDHSFRINKADLADTNIYIEWDLVFKNEENVNQN